MALYLLQIGGDFGIMTEAEILEAALTILHSRDRRVYDSISSRVRAVLGGNRPTSLSDPSMEEDHAILP